ncbi:CLK1 [Symbiodinium microadriaticum]|nr:CLK1 [Symbiodinium microadriaticum]
MVESAAGVEGVACTLKLPAATARPLLNCTPLADDGQVEIALMATEHPAITEFGKTAFEHMKEANALLTTCAPWQELGDFPPGALETYRSAKAFAASLLKQLEQLDSIDLDDLKPDWGDKETVRMARRSAIAFAQQILDRLDGIQALLAAAAEKIRQERSSSAQQEAEVSLQDKYREMFLASASSALPAAKRRRTQPATKAEVEALLKRIRAKTKQEILRQPNKAYYRRLVSLANVGELPQTPALCKEAVECMVSAAVCAVESAPSGKVLGKLFHSLQQLQELSPTELPGILLDMADAVRGLP